MKYKNYIRLIAFFFVLILTNRANAYIAVGPGDTLQVQFRVGQSDIDLNYADNERQITQFCQRVWHNLAENEELQLNIYTGASPEGPAELNRRLGEQRGIALKEVLTERLKGLAIHCAVINEGARWGQLYNKVEQSNEPWREDVLTILGKRPGADEWQTDDREQRLRKLKNGLVWRELNDRYLPPLRTSGSAVIFPVRPLAPSQRDTIVIRDTIIYLPEPCPQYEPPIDLSPAWAIKTNLLLWGVIAPNVQVERSLGITNRWSIEGEIFWPWWTWSHNAHAEQFLNLGVELRYWLGNRQKHHTLDGWHIGMGLAGGYYDFEWKKSEGWQGEYLNVYANLGYQHRFGRRNQWAVDGGLALGWIPTKFRHYVGSSQAKDYADQHPGKGYSLGPNERYDDHLMWLNNGWKHIIGATHVNVSIAYIIGAKKNSSSPSEPYLISDIKNAKKAEKEAKEYEKQNEKQIKENAKRAEKNAAEQAKQAEKEVKAAQKEAEAKTKALEADAKAAEKAKQQADKQVQASATRAEKEAQAQAKAAEKEANAAAKQAEKEAAAMAKEVEAQAKATEKAAAEQAKAAEKAAAEQAKQAEAQAKAAEKAASEQAKAAEKEAAARAKQVEAENKAAEKAASEQAKAAEKEAAARAKQVEADTKAAEKEAQARAKEAEKAAAEQAKQAEAKAKAAEKAAAEQAKQAEAQAKAAEKAASEQAKAAEKEAAARAKQVEAENKAAEKAASEQAKAAEKAAAEQAKQAEAQAKAAEKAASEQAKAAEKEAAARAKQVEAEKKAADKAASEQAKAAEKAAAEQAKQAEAQAKAAEKAAAEQAKAAEKAAAEQAKQAEAAAKQAEKEAAARAKEAEKQAKAAEKEAQAAEKAAKKNANNNK